MRTPKFRAASLIRPTCAGFQPYVAGKPVETIRRELGLARVVKLASNENPLGPSPRAVAALARSARAVRFYPDSNSWELRRALAARFGLPPETIVLGAGSDEIIELVAKAFFRPGDEVVVSEHAFVRYRMAADLMDARTVAVPMRGYTHDLAAMARAVTSRTKAVFIANPNNPTGTYNTRAEFEGFLEAVERRAPKNPPLVVVDEAYYEYARRRADYPETLSYLARRPNLVVLRTFSKIYGLAGLRVGYGFSSADVIGYLDRIRPPFNVSVPAQAAARESLRDPAQVTRSVRLLDREQAVVERGLERLGLPFVPSAANFLLVDVSPLAGAQVFAGLLKRGVIVRAMDEYDYPRHIRVTIGAPAENRLFLRELGRIAGARAPRRKGGPGR